MGTEESNPRPRRPSLRSVEERNALVLQHLPLAQHIARHMRAWDLYPQWRDEILQAAACALLRAAELFDPARGRAFGTYLGAWVRSIVAAELATLDTIRVPRGIAAGDRRALRRRLRPLSLELARERRRGDVPAADLEPADARDDLGALEEEEAVGRRLARLPRREREALRLARLEGLGTDEAARRLGVSRQTISLRVSRAVGRLRRESG